MTSRTDALRVLFHFDGFATLLLGHTTLFTDLGKSGLSSPTAGFFIHKATVADILQDVVHTGRYSLVELGLANWFGGSVGGCCSFRQAAVDVRLGDGFCNGVVDFSTRSHELFSCFAQTRVFLNGRGQLVVVTRGTSAAGFSLQSLNYEQIWTYSGSLVCISDGPPGLGVCHGVHLAAELLHIRLKLSVPLNLFLDDFNEGRKRRFSWLQFRLRLLFLLLLLLPLRLRLVLGGLLLPLLLLLLAEARTCAPLCLR